ncbi:MAG: NifU family protein [Rickettsiales bacterium]|nr:NifU family protein [Rickettsiales bacterium]
MFIQTETTPNPDALKFIPGVEVLPGASQNLPKGDASITNYPLAEALLSLKGVEGVFLASDFLTVTKAPDAGWDGLKAPILTTIMEHFVAGKPMLLEAGQKSKSAVSEDDTPLVKQLKELIETRVRPAVAQDGGDIVFHGFDEKTGVVQLEMHGSCSGCPSSTVTLKHGIENLLKHYVPEVTAVESV